MIEKIIFLLTPLHLLEQQGAVERKIDSGDGERKVRMSGGKAIILILFRSRLRIKLRYGFDVWFFNSRQIQEVQALKFRTNTLAVGVQRIMSVQSHMLANEAMNVQLRGTISCSRAFYHWKAASIYDVLARESRVGEAQREHICQAICAIKNTIFESNRRETGLLYAALDRGHATSSSIRAVSSCVAKSIEHNKMLEEVIKKQNTLAAASVALLAASSSSSNTRTEKKSGSKQKGGGGGGGGGSK